jgi:hypothetical protein
LSRGTMHYGVSLESGVCIAHWLWAQHMDICSMSQLMNIKRRTVRFENACSPNGIHLQVCLPCRSWQIRSSLLQRTSIYFDRS